MKNKVVLSMLVCMTIIITVVFKVVIIVSADTLAPPTPYEITLDEGNRIFYMTPEGEENASQLKSGLYYNVNPPVNIYYANEYFYSDIVLSNDGIYFANLPWSISSTGGVSVDEEITRDLSGQAIGFYKNGSLIKSYSVGDLLKDETKGEYSVSHVMWEDYGKREFNAKKNVLSITTKDDLVYHFDIATGDILGEAELEGILTGPDVPLPEKYIPVISNETAAPAVLTTPTTSDATATPTAPAVSDVPSMEADTLSTSSELRTAPKTSDSYPASLITLSILAAVGLTVLVITKKTKRKSFN